MGTTPPVQAISRLNPRHIGRGQEEVANSTRYSYFLSLDQKGRT